MSAPKIVGVFGISGVGKTSLIRAAIARRDDVLHLQASMLIKQSLSDRSITSEALRRTSSDRVLLNQKALTTMFQRIVAASHGARLVIFDGHLIVDTDSETVEIPLDVVAAITPSSLVHIEATPATIAERRRHDLCRSRPERAIAVLSEHQLRSRILCNQHAASLGIEAHIVTDGSSRVLSELCEQLMPRRTT